MKFDFDIVVVGGGAGGLFAASVANGLGAKACLIEKKRLGGDCTWFGCMPSKALLKSAQVASLFKRYSEFGINIQGSCCLDSHLAMSHVQDVVNEISTHHPAEVFEKRGIKVIFGRAQFINQNTITVNGKNILAKRFILCTGSHPVIPPIEGLNSIGYLTNENVFSLEKLPQSLIVLGGGPIGVELSQGLSRLGVKVYIVEMMERILFREDIEAAKILENRLKNEGIEILTGKKAIKFAKREGLVYVTLEDKDKTQKEISAENVLVAVGRQSNLEGLALEKAGVEYTKGGIKVNAYLQTTNKNIFACGDLVGPYLFSHVASFQAQVCVRNSLLRRIAWQKINYENVPWATFTEPELAHLGLNEEEARLKFKNIRVYKTEYSSSDRAITDVEKEGLIKVITDNKGYILGAHIVGVNAGELMQGFIIAKNLKIVLEKLSRPIYIYPTLSELVKKTAAKPLLEKMNNPLIKFVLKRLLSI
ncbi:MAG TPA: FAD-dependent oxidoreductase [Candidatus Omnitrophota bacterium]|nr:FAD-dependent oxidoreductase [Candidatus Omnitrophota bacterium]